MWPYSTLQEMNPVNCDLVPLDTLHSGIYMETGAESINLVPNHHIYHGETNTGEDMIMSGSSSKQLIREPPEPGRQAPIRAKQSYVSYKSTIKYLAKQSTSSNLKHFLHHTQSSQQSCDRIKIMLHAVGWLVGYEKQQNVNLLLLSSTTLNKSVHFRTDNSLRFQACDTSLCTMTESQACEAVL